MQVGQQGLPVKTAQVVQQGHKGCRVLRVYRAYKDPRAATVIADHKVSKDQQVRPARATSSR